VRRQRRNPARAPRELLPAKARNAPPTTTFFALVSERFSDINAAAGIAMVGSYSALAGFVAPWVVGLLKSATGDFAAGMIFLSAMSFLGGIILLARNAYERRVLGLQTS
jgi:nitrate/nitrite transporter NarK